MIVSDNRANQEGLMQLAGILEKGVLEDHGTTDRGVRVSVAELKAAGDFTRPIRTTQATVAVGGAAAFFTQKRIVERNIKFATSVASWAILHAFVEIRNLGSTSKPELRNEIGVTSSTKLLAPQPRFRNWMKFGNWSNRSFQNHQTL
nr:uncharacterized protein LOC109407007 [Aedes albopictus]